MPEMARLTDVFREGESAYRGLKHRRVPIFIDDNISVGTLHFFKLLIYKLAITY